MFEDGLPLLGAKHVEAAAAGTSAKASTKDRSLPIDVPLSARAPPKVSRKPSNGPKTSRTVRTSKYNDGVGAPSGQQQQPPPSQQAPLQQGSGSTAQSTSKQLRHQLSATSTTAPAPEEKAVELHASAITDEWRSRMADLPLTPAQVLRRYSHELSPYEQGEILEYKKVYFWGNTTQKVQASTRAPNNHGFDDERGDYQSVLHDHLAFRFEVLSTLGRGSFGQVVRCLDYKTGEQVAVKLIRNKRRFHQQALVEVNILTHLRDHDPDDCTNIIHLKSSFYFRSHLCISFPLLSQNLYEFIKENNFNGVSLSLIRRFAIQMLTALRFLRKQGIVHCDLKPENILQRQQNKSGITVIDFGSSCFENERVYTYIQSRFYRSPEVILGLPYGVPIDMWSFGCILAELFTGYPLFPGGDEVEQLSCIMEVMGLPPASLIENASRRKHFFESNGQPRLVPNSQGKVRRPGSKSLGNVLRCNDLLFIDFLTKCLRWDPEERLTPDDALQHEWVQAATVPVKTLPTAATQSLDESAGSSSGRRRRKHSSAHKKQTNLMGSATNLSNVPSAAPLTAPMGNPTITLTSNVMTATISNSTAAAMQVYAVSTGTSKGQSSPRAHGSHNAGVSGHPPAAAMAALNFSGLTLGSQGPGSAVSSTLMLPPVGDALPAIDMFPPITGSSDKVNEGSSHGRRHRHHQAPQPLTVPQPMPMSTALQQQQYLLQQSQFAAMPLSARAAPRLTVQAQPSAAIQPAPMSARSTNVYYGGSAAIAGSGPVIGPKRSAERSERGDRRQQDPQIPTSSVPRIHFPP